MHIARSCLRTPENAVRTQRGQGKTGFGIQHAKN